GIYGIAKCLELARQHGHPAGDHQPTGRRMIVEIGVWRQPILAQHRPRLLYIDALVSDVQGIAEEIQSVGDRAADNYAEHEQAIPPPHQLSLAPAGEPTGADSTRCAPMCAVFSQLL